MASRYVAALDKLADAADVRAGGHACAGGAHRSAGVTAKPRLGRAGCDLICDIWNVRPSIQKIQENRRFNQESAVFLARREGFEPPAFWSVARRSIQLS